MFRKIYKTFLITALITTLVSCLPETAVPEKEKTGFIQITAGSLADYNSHNYTAVFTSSENDPVTESWNGSRYATHKIPAGVWSITLSAIEGNEVIAAGNTENVEVTVGETAIVTIPLAFLSEGDGHEEPEPVPPAGTFSWTVNLPNGAAAANLTKALMSVKDAQGAAVSGSPFSLLNGSSTGTIEKLAAGSWTIEFDLELRWGNSALRSATRRVEVIQIVKDQTLSKTYTFEYKDFTLALAAEAGSGSAYDVIQSRGFDYESPDQANGGHENFGPHIIQQYDAALNKNVFAFLTHRGNDRNATGDWTRQRVEIKVDHRNNAGRDYCAVSEDEGRVFIYRWKFKLPAELAVSTEFSHIHQIKNEGGDASQPIVALTARAMSGNTDRRLQLTYYAPGSSSPAYWVNAANSLDDYLGQWVQCEESVSYSSNQAQAAYSLKITRITDGQVLMNYTAPANSIQTWRDGNTHGRPKFGLYRRIFSGNSPGTNTEPDSSNAVSGLKDEVVLFADFEIVRVR